MKKKALIPTVVLCLIILFACNKQEDNIVDQKNHSNENKSDVVKALEGDSKELYDLAKKYINKDNDNVVYFANQLLIVSVKKGDKKGELLAHYILGYVYELNKFYIMSLTHTFQSLVICKELGEEKQMAECYRTIGIIYFKVGLYNKSILNYEKAIEQFKILGDKKNSAQLYYGIAITYREAKQYKEAEEYFIKSAGIQKELGNQEELADVYNSLGNLFKEIGAYEKALSYLSQSLAISESMNHAELMALALHNTGYVLYQQKKYTEAKEYYTKALAQSEKVNDFPELLIWIHRDMGLNELALKEAEKAIPYLEKGEAIAQGSKQAKLEIELTAILSQVYKKLRNIDKALYYSEKSRSIQAENLIPEIKRLGDEFEKKNTIDGFKENSIQKREGDSNRFFYIVLSSLISLLVGGSGIYFIKRRQNKTMGGKGKLVEIEERLEMVLTKVAEVMKNKSSYSQLIQQEAQAIYAKMQEIEAHQQHISKRGISKRKLKELWDMLQNSKSFLALANQQKANSIDHS